MEDIYQDTDTNYVVAQMARRIAYQTKRMKGVERERQVCYAMERDGFLDLPKQWLKLSDEWCNVHHIDTIHGVLALLHFKSMFGTGWSELELWVILDAALERSYSVEWG